MGKCEYTIGKGKEGKYNMARDTLFEQRIIVGRNLKDCIRNSGFTKVSFSKKTDISRPTLDRLLNGTVDSKSTFDRHLQKILNTLNMTADQLLSYSSVREVRKVDAVYSLNAPADYVMNEKTKKQYGLLMDVVDLCATYY